MTSSVAIIGKSGSGKTTITKSFLKLLRKKFTTSSILLIDNDLSLELSDSFGIKTKNTIYGIKSGKHEYKTGIPAGMSKQEYIEWALEDIIISVDDYTDIIASWFVTPKDCKCPSTKLIRDSLSKLIDRYDFVIFDSEFDLKYLNLLVDYPIDETIVVSLPDKNSIAVSSKIVEFSKKYAIDGNLEILLNRVKKEDIDNSMELINALGLDFLGSIDEFDNIDYDKIAEKLDVIYSRMNLIQYKEEN